MTLESIIGLLPEGTWGSIGLCMFLAIFLCAVVYAFRKDNAPMFERALRMPLEDDDPSCTSIAPSTSSTLGVAP